MVTRDNLCAIFGKPKFKGLLGILIKKVHYDYSKKKELNLSKTYLGREDFAQGISKTVFSRILSLGMTKCFISSINHLSNTIFLQRTVP